MDKNKVIALLDEKLHEVFATLQEQEGITEGDIDPMDSVELDRLTEQAAELIIKVIGYQK